MLNVTFNSKFWKDVERAKSRNLDIDKLKGVINRLSHQLPLEPKFRDHKLTGQYEGCRECHIEPDWLLIYKIYKNKLELVLLRTGSHSDLF